MKGKLDFICIILVIIFLFGIFIWIRLDSIDRRTESIKNTLVEALNPPESMEQFEKEMKDFENGTITEKDLFKKHYFEVKEAN